MSTPLAVLAISIPAEGELSNAVSLTLSPNNSPADAHLVEDAAMDVREELIEETLWQEDV